MSIHETTVSIINKWNAQKKFVRYIDGKNIFKNIFNLSNEIMK